MCEEDKSIDEMISGLGVDVEGVFVSITVKMMNYFQHCLKVRFSCLFVVSIRVRIIDL